MKKNLVNFSLVMTIITAFIPTHIKELPYYHGFGKPYEVFAYTETGHWTVNLLDVVSNFLNFYLVFYLSLKLFNKLRQNIKSIKA
jgi:hypothetical protein